MEEQKKYFIISTIMFVIIAIVILQIDKYYDNKVKNSYTLETNKLNNKYINVNDFGIYLQDKEYSNNYVKQSTNNYPTEGYILNTSRTECFDYHGVKQAGKVSQTDEGRVRLETTVSIYCQMYFDIDNTKPTIKSFTISGTAKDGKANSNYIYKYTIDYTVTWEDSDVVYYCVKEGVESCSESDWQKISVTNKTISGSLSVSTTDGAKTINAYVRDRAKNVSEVVTGTSNKTIILDRTAPTISEFTLTGNKEANSSVTPNVGYTHTTTANYSVTWSSSDVVSFCINTSNNVRGCNWNSDSSSPGTLNEQTIPTSTTQGEKTLYAFVKDAAGNVSSSKVGNIKYDSTDPSVSISNETSTTDTITYTITASDDYPSGGVTTSCRAVASGKTTNGTISGTICTIKGLSENTSYTIYAKGVDLSGRYKEVNKTISTKSAKLGDYVKSKNPKGLSTGELGGLYRFVGACDAANGGCTGTVDNFICFGTETPSTNCAGKVDSDYMYRIIGIDPSTGNLKLIKNTAIREEIRKAFVWHSYSNSDYLVWPHTYLFGRLNGNDLGITTGWNGTSNLFIDSTTSNVTYIKSTGDDNDTKWYKMIKDTNWLYGDIWAGGSSISNSDVNKPADEVYAIETGKQETKTGYYGNPYTWTEKTELSKIGLMYIHDYYYSYEGKGTTNCFPSSAGCKASWLHISKNGNASDTQNEWTIVRMGRSAPNGFDFTYSSWYVYSDGSVSHGGLDLDWSVRPVFYLDSTYVKLTGSGTYSDPFVAMPINS